MTTQLTEVEKTFRAMQRAKATERKAQERAIFEHRWAALNRAQDRLIAAERAYDRAEERAYAQSAHLNEQEA